MKEYDFIEVRVSDYKYTDIATYFRKKKSALAYITNRITSTADKKVYIICDGGEGETALSFLQKYGIDLLFSINGITTIASIGVKTDLYGCPIIREVAEFHIKIIMRKFED